MLRPNFFGTLLPRVIAPSGDQQYHFIIQIKSILKGREAQRIYSCNPVTENQTTSLFTFWRFHRSIITHSGLAKLETTLQRINVNRLQVLTANMHASIQKPPHLIADQKTN